VPHRLAVVTLLLMFLMPVSARAQDPQVSLGVLAGGTVADQAGEDAFTPHDRFGFIGGVSLALRLSGRWSVQLDGLYVQKGGRENNDNDPGDLDDELSLVYLEFPVLVKFALSAGATRPELFVGPSFAYELSCRYDSFPDGSSDPVSCAYDSFPDGSSDPVSCAEAGIQTRTLDVGVAFGADVEIPLGSGYLVVDGRGIVALGSFDDSDDDLDYRNRILSLMVGYRFTL